MTFTRRAHLRRFPILAVMLTCVWTAPGAGCVADLDEYDATGDGRATLDDGDPGALGASAARHGETTDELTGDDAPLVGGAGDASLVAYDDIDAYVTTCTDACNPGWFAGKRWSCQANPYQSVGNSCSSGWQECVPGCNPGQFQDTFWTCDADPRRHTGTTCSSGWRLCNPTSCEGALGIDVCTRDSDGCSTPFYSPYDSVFYDACVGHDHCYATPGKSKSSCDSAFLDDMISECFFLDFACLAAADTYAAAVALSPQGQDAYNNDQAAVNGCYAILDRGRIYYP